VPTDPEIQSAVKHALDVRQQQADAVELDTLFRVVRGKMRLDVHTQLAYYALQAVDWLVGGRKNIPPANRPQLRSLVEMKVRSLEELGAQPLPPAVIEALVNVAAGWMIARSLPVLPGVGQTIVMDQTVGIYLEGSRPADH
jgi:hypothetical protein